jgi:amino acid permease
MKKVNIILFVVLAIIAIYLFYKLIVSEEWNNIDYILLIVLLLGASINSSIIAYRRKKKGMENE